jgi:triosephosphate isomerase
MIGTAANAGYVIKSATKGTIGTVVNALYAIKNATKVINGRGVSVKNAGNMPITRYITGSSVSMASSMLPV